MFSSNATQVSAVTQAEAVDYDSTNDYLSRSTYYNGYVNALTFLKETFTFSCWFYNGESTGNAYVFSSGASAGNANLFYVNISTTTFQIAAYDGSGTFILNATTTNRLPLNTFCNVLISIDMTSTSNRYVYVNDQLMTMTWSNYVNSTIQFGTLIQRVNSLSNSVDPTACRISNVFLDFTYRDLSITANRRLFVTADLKPAAGQAALNPIVYLAMSDPTTVGTNTGTGGNFTLNGTIARSGRGPNQYNAPYSDLDGSTDYLSKATNLTGIANSKLITLQFCMNLDTVSSGYLLYFDDNGGASSPFRVYLETNGEITIDGFANIVTQCLKVRTVGTSFVAGRNYVITVSVDMSSTSRRFFYVNGSAISPTWTTYSNLAIVLNYASPSLGIGADGAGSTKTNGRLGALWFNTSYIDLSVASNLAKFVSGTGINAKPVDLGATGELPTGTSPLIYLPMYGNNAGKNYGTGGDFTVNSGPYTGARGPNEFWGNFADFDGTTGYLSRTSALSGVSDGKTFTANLFFKTDDISTNGHLLSFSFANGYDLRIGVNSSGYVFIKGDTSAGVEYLRATASTTAMVAGTTYCIQVCIDLNNTANRRIYVNNVLQSVTWTTYTNQNFSWTTMSRVNIGVNWNGASYTFLYNGKLSELYFTTEYIDFSQEANRLKFRDCFGNPTDLPSAITALSVPNPAIYMRFPPTSFGTNSGTGGNFTVNGTITDGGQL